MPRDLHARQLAHMVFPPAIWKQLRLSGEAPDGKFAETEKLCRLFFDDFDQDTSSNWQLDPITRQEVQRILDRYPGKRSLVIIMRSVMFRREDERAHIRNAAGHTIATVETGKTNRWENGNVGIRVRVITPDGYVWVNGIEDGPDNRDDDKNFTKAAEAVANLFDGFPLQIVDASSAVQPSGPATGGRASSPVDLKQRFQNTQEHLEREHQKLRATTEDEEADYQGWMKTATKEELEAPEFAAVAEHHAQTSKNLAAIAAEHDELVKSADASREAPTTEQLQQVTSGYHALAARLRDEKTNLHKMLQRLKEISRKYK